MRDGDQLSLTRCGCSMRAWFRLNRFGAFACLAWSSWLLWLGLAWSGLVWQGLATSGFVVAVSVNLFQKLLESLAQWSQNALWNYQVGYEACWVSVWETAAPTCGLIPRPR